MVLYKYNHFVAYFLSYLRGLGTIQVFQAPIR